jgi:predicted ATPase
MHVLIVATMRSAGMDVADVPLTRLLSHRNCERNRLPPLTDSEISHYLDALLGERDPALHRAVQKISEGNAFFMVELGRQLRQNPELDAGALAIPSVALEPVRQRLAQLRKDTVSVLTHAAAIGRSFSLARLDAISEIQGTDLIAHLDEVVTNEIVRRAARSPSEFSFTHDLLRAALREALGPAEWRALRLRALDALDENLSLTDLDPVHERTALPALCRAPLAALTHAHEAQVAESVARLQRMRR